MARSRDFLAPGCSHLKDLAMARWLSLFAVVMIAAWSSGCAICCAPYDDYYPAVGGRWVRDNPAYGRVGSAFDAAGHRVDDVAVSATSSTPAPATPAQSGARTVAPRRDGASSFATDE